MPTPTLTLTRPDDWHLHLRDGAMLRAVLPATARRFARAIVMPNLRPPVLSVQDAMSYRRRILESLPPGIEFEPLMTLYLTGATTPAEIAEARACGQVHGVKLYPAGATTHSDQGVTSIERCMRTLGAMEQEDLPLLIHGEVVDPHVDVFDREQVFIDRVLIPLIEQLPRLRIVLEHITTAGAVEFVRQAPPTVAGTITVHHLLLNRNAMLEGGIRPHHYCLPILKRERHRQALVAAATSGSPKFFLGTDSAPHARAAKESACGCAGIYSAHGAIELYAQVFEEAGALDRLEPFASFHGADFYGLRRNTSRLTLVREPWQMEPTLGTGETALVPLWAGQTVHWKLAASQDKQTYAG